MARLATKFAERGHEVSVVTAAWQEEWPRQVVYRGVPVFRIRQSPRRWQGTWQYMRGLGRWLRTHRGDYDAILVSMLKHSAYVAVQHGLRTGCPVILRAEGSGETGDCRFQETARFGKRIRRRCRQATAIIAPAQSVADELLMAGYDREKVVTIANGVPIPATIPSRAAARQALAGIHSDLQVPDDQRLVVYTGRLDRAKGLRELLDAWPAILRQHGGARLWLVGEGPYRDELYQRIKDAELQHSVCMPGTFDDVSDLLAAADLFVLPSYAEGLSLSLLEAMAHGVPVVASDVPGNRQVIADASTGRLVPPRDAAALSRVMLELLDNPAGATALGQAGRRRVEQAFSLERMADLHLDVIRQAVAATLPRTTQENA